ncbi:MAG: fimbrial biogenesis outer membrane usher protein, partial [Lysobacterales bacterium]
MRRALPVAVSLALAAAAAAADPAPSNDSTLIVELRLNEQAQTTTLVARRDADGTLLVPAAPLEALRVRRPERGLVLIDGEPYVRLGTELGADVRFDEATQSAQVILPPSAFVPTVSVASPDAPPQVTPAELGGFLNYDLSGESVDGRSSLGGFFDAGAYGPRGVYTQSLVARDDTQERGVVRLESTWTLDLPDRLATLRVGDSISAPGAWGRAVRLGGVQFGTNFATQPTLVTTPFLAAQGEAVVPSTVDVFVNGNRVTSQDVPPGPFTIERLPPVTGAGQMQVVVTDALGRQQVIAQPYYTGPSLLRAGLVEYSLEVGAIREDYALRSNAYGDAVASATLRRGLTDQLTTEVRAEGQVGGAAAAGVDVAWQVGALGVVSLTGAAGGEGDVGWLAGAGFERNGRRASVFVRVQQASEDFAQVGGTAQSDRLRQRSFGGVGYDLGRYGGLQLSYGRETRWDGPSSSTIGLAHSVTLGEWGFVSLVASHTRAEDDARDLFVSWTLPFGRRSTASTSLRYSPDAEGIDEFEAVASVQRDLPPGSGTGYFASISSSEDARLEYLAQGSAGTVGAQYARRDGTDGWRVNATGGLAVTDAGVLPARRLDRSFAVVEVADYPGMTVYVENQPIGRTDEKGRVLLDSLRAYETNAISIDPRELPLDASLSTPRIVVTPAYRSGPVVRFPVVRASAATLRVLQPDGSPVPAGAQFVTTHESVPVALDGLVYLSHAAGVRDAVVEW